MKNPECRGGNDPVLGFLLANWQDERLAKAHYPSNQSMKPTSVNANTRQAPRFEATSACLPPIPGFHPGSRLP
jgi:hypothetical protein